MLLATQNSVHVGKQNCGSREPGLHTPKIQVLLTRPKVLDCNEPSGLVPLPQHGDPEATLYDVLN